MDLKNEVVLVNYINAQIILLQHSFTMCCVATIYLYMIHKLLKASTADFKPSIATILPVINLNDLQKVLWNIANQCW